MAQQGFKPEPVSKNRLVMQCAVYQYEIPTVKLATVYCVGKRKVEIFIFMLIAKQRMNHLTTISREPGRPITTWWVACAWSQDINQEKAGKFVKTTSE